MCVCRQVCTVGEGTAVHKGKSGGVGQVMVQSRACRSRGWLWLSGSSLALPLGDTHRLVLETVNSHLRINKCLVQLVTLKLLLFLEMYKI